MPDTLDRTVIALPLLELMRAASPDDLFNIIVDVNLEYVDGRAGARRILWQWIDELPGVHPTYEAAHGGAISGVNSGSKQEVNAGKSKYSQQYLFGRLSAENIRQLVRRNEEERKRTATARGRSGPSPLYRIWLDDKVKRFTNLSISTVKADAARNAFGTSGKNILWAVVDTGIDQDHPHFRKYENLKLSAPIGHRDFTTDSADDADLARTACIDKAGHGTHVAGIIVGQVTATDDLRIVATVRSCSETGDVSTDIVDDIPVISGMAPRCKLLSLKVLDDDGKGRQQHHRGVEYIQELNGYGRRIACTASTSASATSSSRVVRLRAEPALRRSRPAGALRRGRRRRRRQHRLRLRCSSERQRPRRAGLGPHDQRSRQRRPARSPSAPRTATCRTPTACRTSRRRARPATAASSPTSSRPASGSSRARGAEAASPQAEGHRDKRNAARYIETAAPAWRRRTYPARSPRSCRSVGSSSASPERVKRIFVSTATDLGRERLLPRQRPGRPDARNPVGLTERSIMESDRGLPVLPVRVRRRTASCSSARRSRR